MIVLIKENAIEEVYYSVIDIEKKRLSEIKEEIKSTEKFEFYGFLEPENKDMKLTKQFVINLFKTLSEERRKIFFEKI